MKVYLSSTYVDLREYREGVYRTLCKIEGVQVVAMEDYVACDERPVNKCLDDVENCNVYIGLFAWRYGFIPDGHEHSITNLEYLKAVETDKPIFIFLLDDKAAWPDDFIDKPPDNIVSLRVKLENSLIVSYFRYKEDLSKEVAVVISNHLNKNKSIIQGIPHQEYISLAKDLGVTENAVKNFFTIIRQKEVPKEDWNFTLRQIATRHKELQERLKQYENFIVPEIQEIRNKAEQAINNGEYYKADIYLDEAFEQDMKLLNHRKLSAAENRVIKGDSKMLRINYKAATKLFKEAVELVPDGHELKKGEYLQKWGDAARDAGLYPESQTALEKCLAIREKLLPKDDIIIATTLNNLALLYRSQGKDEEAEPLYQRDLEITKKILGKDHPNVATTLNNLAELYRSQGKYEEAEPLYQRSLVIWEKSLGNDNSNVASTLNNLAGLYRSQGKCEEAEPLYQRSLGILEKTLGKDHPNVASTLNNLAGLYRSQGKCEEAEPLYQRSLGIREILGKDHPSVASSLNNLAVLYRSQGKYEEAEPFFQKSLEIWEKALGNNHPNVASTLNNMAGLYRSQGKYEEAEPLYQRSLLILEKALGKDHPSVASSLNNLAVLYRSQGKYAEAEPLYQRSVWVWEKALGNNHPNVASSLNNLAGLYYHQKKYNEAVYLFKRVLTIFEKSLGKSHPNYKIAMANYLIILEESKK